ncbi:MAG: TonB-dependent receptor plug domain-containing protein, partial [Bacteroidales bacterium]
MRKEVLLFGSLFLIPLTQSTARSETPEKKHKADSISLSGQLEEVVVIAYGTGKKSALTGAASVVSGANITNRPLATVTSAIMGNTPGVQSTLADGQPGSSPGLRIRGFGSINASSEPLYIVDGAVYTGPISNINPADVASVTILKDAAATALYGSSAGNGVVQITTRRASGENDTRVNLRISQGFSQRGIPEYDRVDLWNYYPLQWEMLKNQYIFGSGQSPETAATNASANLYTQLGKFNIFQNVPNEAIVLTDGQLNPAAKHLLYNDFDWAGAAYRNGYRGEYNLSFSTNTDKSDTYASVSFLDD